MPAPLAHGFLSCAWGLGQALFEVPWFSVTRVFSVAVSILAASAIIQDGRGEKEDHAGPFVGPVYFYSF